MSKQENTEYTKQYITTALFQLMEKKPYDKISIVEITSKAGVSRVTYYRHFTSKDDIIIQMFKSEIAETANIFYFVPKTKDDYYEILFTILTKFKEKKHLMSLIRQAHLEHIYLEFLNETMKANYQSHDDRVETDYAPYYYAGCFFNVSMEWLRHDCADPVKKVSDAFFRCLFSDYS